MQNAKEKEAILQILKWCCSDSCSLPEEINNENILLQLLYIHRLSGRMLARLSKINRHPFTHEFIQELHRQQDAAYDSLNRQIFMMNEILASFKLENKPFLLKGLTSYALTNNSLYLRRSGDLDITFDDTEYLSKVLIELGYARTPGVASHEEGNYHRGPYAVDVHKYFNVRQYPDTLRQSAVYKSRSIPSVISALPDATESKITYDRLKEHTAKSLIEGTEAYLLSNVTMNVLIHCVHLFRSYLKFSGKQIGIILAELMNVIDSTDHKDFDLPLFSRLVQQFKASDSVEFVCHIIHQWMGTIPNNLRVFHNTDYSLLRGFWGVWGNFDTIEDLLFPKDTLIERSREVEHLGFTEVEITTPANPISYTYKSFDEIRSLRVITVTSKDNPTPFDLPFQLSLHVVNEVIQTLLTLSSAFVQYEYMEIIVNFNKTASHKLIYAYGKCESEQGHGQVQTEKLGTGYEISVAFPISKLIPDLQGLQALVIQLKTKKGNEVMNAVVPVKIMNSHLLFNKLKSKKEVLI